MSSYLIVKISGKNINRFLHKCKENNINLLNINLISHKEVLIKIYEYDYKKLLKIKSIYKINIINSAGYLRFKQILTNNKIFIYTFIIGVVLLVILSNIIFNVNVISNNNELNEKVLKELELYGIKKYRFKKSYSNIQKIKNKINNKFKDKIQWLEIDSKGTTYEIKVVERKENKEKMNNEYTNVVAKKSGVVRKIYAEDGQKQIELNTYVNKGDILISGEITKGEEIKQYVHAKGKIYAEVWYDVTIEFPLEYTEKIYTKNEKNIFYIKLNDKYIEKTKYRNYERKNILSLKNRLIPFEIGIEKVREVKIINDKYTQKEAKKKAEEKAKEKISERFDKDEYIISEKTLNFKQKNSKIVLDMFFSCLEEISKEEKIQQKQE